MKTIPAPRVGKPTLRPVDKLLAVTSTPSALLLVPDPAAPLRTEHLAVYDQADGGYIATRRTEEAGQVVEEVHWLCKTPEEVEEVLGRGFLAHSLYHLARLQTPCNRHRDGVLNISAHALSCAVWAELTHVQPQPQLDEATHVERKSVAAVWLRVFREVSPGKFRDTGAVRRHVQKMNRSGMEVPEWQVRMCIYEWKLWHEQRAIEEFDGLGLERSA
ncbi:hypothetical protein [Deinococcus marmoris]|uniref:Uncharacterized protein n=1 Tax=Deinococcus marmoris TaxID=249408 RepID=A0A1U7NUT4_9DEIO|nr:hypothetical protein [Deinococcus marmoris]OLV16681.1 hypothetical protein BOO71_0011068 [Deinococcus marmoris]